MLSFSTDLFSGVFDMASTIVNGLFPVYLIPLGIMIGIGILGLIMNAFKGTFRGMR